MDNSEVKYIFLPKGSSMDNRYPLEGYGMDVIVKLQNDDTYWASFFSFNNLKTIRESCKGSGEYLKGKYFWVNNMLLIEDYSKSEVHAVIHDLILKGDFITAFQKL